MMFNPFAIAVAQRLVGHPDDGGLSMSGANTNVAYAAGPGHPPTVQEVHTDSAELFDAGASEADFTPPGSIYVNVPLCDADADTGATEMWLGTHRDPGLRRGMGYGDPGLRRSTSWPTPDMLSVWERRHGPAVRALAERGDILLRDARVWHRGRENLGQTHRQCSA